MTTLVREQRLTGDGATAVLLGTRPEMQDSVDAVAKLHVNAGALRR